MIICICKEGRPPKNFFTDFHRCLVPPKNFTSTSSKWKLHDIKYNNFTKRDKTQEVPYTIIGTFLFAL